MTYSQNSLYDRDLKNVTDTAREEGREEGKIQGREEGKIQGQRVKQQEIIIKLYRKGYNIGQIAEMIEVNQEVVMQEVGQQATINKP